MNIKSSAGKFVRAIRVNRLLLAVLMGLLLGLAFARVDGSAKAGDLFAFFASIGFIGFAILLHVVNRIRFWFYIFFAIEWALIPVGTGIAAAKFSGTGWSGIGGGIGQGLLLALTIPIGIIGCIVFLFLAYKNRNEQGAAIKNNEPDVPSQIRELAKLRDEGILSQEEFESKKADLLSRL